MTETLPKENFKIAVRLNAFKNVTGLKGKTILEKHLNFIGNLDDVSFADLNYPDHCQENSVVEIKKLLDENNIMLNGLAMRYYSNPAFSIGAFTNPDRNVRREAIDLTKRGLDMLSELGGNLMTIWLGQDGFDYSFQCDYSKLWDTTIEAFVEISEHNPNINLSIEYKPNEPRAFSLMPDVSTTLLAIKDINRENVGITLDFCHILYADEMPTFALMLANRHSQLMGVHLNDGYGKRDDGLMVGTVHPIQLLEFLVHLQVIGYKGIYYFDTFPDLSGLNPLYETKTNIILLKRFLDISKNLLNNNDLMEAMRVQDATISQKIIAEALYGK